MRDRTKDRYAVAGAWNLDNLEGKATLRAIVAGGSWGTSRAHFLEKSRTDFERGLRQRIQQAVARGRVTDEQATKILSQNASTEVLDQAV